MTTEFPIIKVILHHSVVATVKVNILISKQTNKQTNSHKGSNVARWNGKEWTTFGNEKMKLVSCGADGTLWGINRERFTFSMKRDTGEWVLMPGSFKQVS